MSGFDGNPFADPSAANPFADPAVMQHTTQSAEARAAVAAGLEEYNPFADNDAAATVPAVVQTSDTSPAAVLPQPVTTPLPAYQPPAEPVIQPSPVVETKQDPVFPGEPSSQPSAPPALAASDSVGNNDATSGLLTEPATQPLQSTLTAEQQMELARRDPNFPPLPSCCPVKPCFYHNIQLEISSDHQSLVRFLFIYWEVQVVAYFYNMIALLALFADTGLFGKDFGFSVLWFIAFSPCSFVCWYHCAYKAFLVDSSLRFMWFFVVFFCQCVYNVIQAVGFVSSGSCGLILVLEAKGKAHAGTFFMGIAAFVVWTLMSLVSFFLLVKLHRYYRSSGHSLKRVQSEAGTALAQNEGVRSAVVSGVKASF